MVHVDTRGVKSGNVRHHAAVVLLREDVGARRGVHGGPKVSDKQREILGDEQRAVFVVQTPQYGVGVRDDLVGKFVTNSMSRKPGFLAEPWMSR